MMFKNTFAPHVKNETFSVHDIIAGLRTTLLDAKSLPSEVQDAVTSEIKRQETRKNDTNDTAIRA